MNPFNNLSQRDTFSRIREHTKGLFRAYSHTVHPDSWQGRDVTGKPEMTMWELLNYSFTHNLRGIEDLDHWRQDIKPNLPWADDHFEERVCGYPINPGIEWENWPWNQSADGFRNKSGQFNHNYMERYWPKHTAAVHGPTRTAEEFVEKATEHHEYWQNATAMGIREVYGDLNDLIEQLANNPYSNQQFLPIFFPEDVGEVEGGRKPCSLGYQFYVRNDHIHIYYPMRACDFARHMQDDIYLTLRLLLWVLDKCRGINPDFWSDIKPGLFTMHCTSLHLFANDMVELRNL